MGMEAPSTISNETLAEEPEDPSSADNTSATAESHSENTKENGEENGSLREVYPTNPNPAAIIFCLQSRLAKQQNLNRKILLEKDHQLQQIASSLMLLESRLRSEQKRLVQLLQDKDNKLSEQDRCIQALLRLNRRISSRLSTALRHPQDQPQTGPEDQEQDDEDTETSDEDSVITFGSLIEEDDQTPMNKKAISNLKRGTVVHGTWSSPSSSTMDRAKMTSCPKHPNVERLRRAAGVSRGPNLSVVYNRVMCNHRSVIKPKDVKYKKISRVKSRSLEELRGQLKVLSQPNGPVVIPLGGSGDTQQQLTL